jgi:hypothetical protein
VITISARRKPPPYSSTGQPRANREATKESKHAA